MPLTPAETAQWDQDLADFDHDVTELTAIIAKWLPEIGPDRAISEMFLHLREKAYDWDEVAILLAVAIRKLAEQQEVP